MPGLLVTVLPAALIPLKEAIDILEVDRANQTRKIYPGADHLSGGQRTPHHLPHEARGDYING